MPVDWTLPANRSGISNLGFAPSNFNSLVNVDLTARAESFPPIVHIWRRTGDSGTDEANSRPWENDSLSWAGTRDYYVVATTTTIVPEDVLPGSSNRATQDGTSPASQAKLGGIQCYSFGSDAVVDFMVRRITNSIPTGTTTVPTYNDFVVSRAVHSGANNQSWIPATQIITPPSANGAVLPDGTLPGDLLEIIVAFRQGSASTDPAFLSGVIVEWAKLTTLAPP